VKKRGYFKLNLRTKNPFFVSKMKKQHLLPYTRQDPYGFIVLARPFDLRMTNPVVSLPREKSFPSVRSM